MEHTRVVTERMFTCGTAHNYNERWDRLKRVVAVFAMRVFLYRP